MLGHLLMAAMLLVNTSALWAQLEDPAQDPASVSHAKPCHTEQAPVQDTQPSAGHGCCDDAAGCSAACKCPAMASPALFDNQRFNAVKARAQLVTVPQATPIQSDPKLLLQPPRQDS